MTTKEYAHEYYLQHKEKIKKATRAYQETHRDVHRTSNKKYYLKNKAKIASYHQKHRLNPSILAKEKMRRQTNKEARNKREVELRSINPQNAIVHRLRSRIYWALRRGEADRNGSTFELTGCTPEQLQQYLESKFLEGMSWNNRSDWHIDHIIPCISFDLTDPEQQKKCFHYTNLQPLWAKDNLSKHAKLA